MVITKIVAQVAAYAAIKFESARYYRQVAALRPIGIIKCLDSFGRDEDNPDG